MLSVSSLCFLSRMMRRTLRTIIMLIIWMYFFLNTVCFFLKTRRKCILLMDVAWISFILILMNFITIFILPIIVFTCRIREDVVLMTMVCLLFYVAAIQQWYPPPYFLIIIPLFTTRQSSMCECMWVCWSGCVCICWCTPLSDKSQAILTVPLSLPFTGDHCDCCQHNILVLDSHNKCAPRTRELAGLLLT